MASIVESGGVDVVGDTIPVALELLDVSLQVVVVGNLGSKVAAHGLGETVVKCPAGL